MASLMDVPPETRAIYNKKAPKGVKNLWTL